MAKNKKEKENAIDQPEVNETNDNQTKNENNHGGDISSVKFNQIYIALAVCISLMIIAKLIGL